MSIVRTYQCDQCGEKFDKLHFDRSEPAPDCPVCKALESRQVPAGFSIGSGTHSKAMDITQDIMEKDMGFTNFKDGLREGDIAAPSVPSHLQEATKSFWTQSGPIIQAAKQGAATAKSEGKNPFTMVQKAMKARR